ncbi:MAG: RING finger protein [Endozoicomonas sp.]
MEARQPSKLSAAEPVSPPPAIMQDIEHDMEESCPICTTVFGRDVEVALTFCGHKFDEKCLRRCFAAGGTNCPICRTPLCDRDIKGISPYVLFSQSSGTPDTKQKDLNRRLLNALINKDKEKLFEVMKEEVAISEESRKVLSLRLIIAIKKNDRLEIDLLTQTKFKPDEQAREYISNRVKEALEDRNYFHLGLVPFDREISEDVEIQKLMKDCWMDALTSQDTAYKLGALRNLGLVITTDCWREASIRLEKAYMMNERETIGNLESHGVNISPQRKQEIESHRLFSNQQIREALRNDNYMYLEKLTEQVWWDEDTQRIMNSCFADAIKASNFFRMKALIKAGVTINAENDEILYDAIQSAILTEENYEIVKQWLDFYTKPSITPSNLISVLKEYTRHNEADGWRRFRQQRQDYPYHLV